MALVGLLLLAAPGAAQDLPADPSPVAAKRAQALTLSDQGRHPEALPLLEEMSTAFPDDPLIWERYGLALLGKAATVADEAGARQLRVAAKRALTRSRELGNMSQLMALADAINADGSEPSTASTPDGQAAMKLAEAAFARGDFSEAITHYQKTLTFEPANYLATLFVGDMYYRMQDTDRASEWFSRAIAIAPDRETAHRYWGDALTQAGRLDEARRHFVDAVVAEPYNRLAQGGMSQFVKRVGARLGRPALTTPTTMQNTATGAQHTLNADAVKPGAEGMAAAWSAYAEARLQFQKEEFSQRFPTEPVYRHSLAEEIYAFERLIAFADEQAAQSAAINDPQLSTIRGLRQRGFLEPYVLIHAADAGIVRDYVAYRNEHRERIRAYVDGMIAMPAK
jgi:tetratricopeptide (TPR) repeat protein